MKKQNKQLGDKIFKLICNSFGHKFSFNAIDLNDATSKAKDWCNYHSHRFSDYKVEETTESKWIHNEYMV